MRHEERTILNRRVGIWQFIVVVAVAIVLALIVSIVVGNVPAH
jgi:anti-sigma-K factor RskA